MPKLVINRAVKEMPELLTSFYEAWPVKGKTRFDLPLNGDFQELHCSGDLCVQGRRFRSGLFSQIYEFRSTKPGYEPTTMPYTTNWLSGFSAYRVSAGIMSARPGIKTEDIAASDFDLCVTLLGPLGRVRENFVAFGDPD